MRNRRATPVAESSLSQLVQTFSHHRPSRPSFVKLAASPVALAVMAVTPITAHTLPTGRDHDPPVVPAFAVRESLGKIVVTAARPLPSVDAQQLARLRAVMPQETQLAFDFSARETVELGRFPDRLHPTEDEDAIVDQAMQTFSV